MSRAGRWTTGCATVLLLLVAGFFALSRRYAETSSEQLQALAGMSPAPLPAEARFAFDELGGLSTHALQSNAGPWKVIVAALLTRRPELLEGHSVDQAARLALQEFGFTTPDSIMNWSGPDPRPALRMPLGVVSGWLQLPLPGFRLEIANLGCPACHTGVTYDATGEPQSRVWLGTPNTSIDFEAYITAIYQGLRELDQAPNGLLHRIGTLFPETPAAERRTLRFLIAPQISRRLRSLPAGTPPLPFHNGAPGLTNGVASLKLQAGLLGPGSRAREVGFTSIPDLGYRRFRSSLLYDGTYTPPDMRRFAERGLADSAAQHLQALAGIVAFFTIPTFGSSPERAEQAIESVKSVMTFLDVYRPPPFPGPRDTALARVGRDAFTARCAHCHGSYDANPVRPTLAHFPNRLVKQQDMGTDPTRWQSIDDELLAYIAGSRVWSGHVVAARTGGYVAPILSGLWTTAPYLHNGAVPTLWHLLDPASRPQRFYVGGHRLRFDLVGVDGELDEDGTWRYPTGYRPWSRSQLYDTRLPGLSNAGHEVEFRGLTPRERRALLEYLKGL